jgi:hypothetical protein
LPIVRALFLNLALFLLVAAALLLVATGIAYPWRPQPPVGGALAAYAPARNGSAGLWRRTDSRNAPAAWASENVRVLPTLAALGGSLRADVAQAILDEHPAGAAAAAAPLMQISVLDEHVRNVDGAIQRQSRTHVRTPRGEFLQSISTPDGAGDLLFRPGFWLYPADLSPARTAPWSSAGTINGTIGYTATGRVIAAGPFTATLGAWPHCLQVEHRLDLTQADALLSRTSTRTWLCADLGAVMVEEFDAEGALTLRSELISLDGQPLARGRSGPPAARRTLPAGARRGAGRSRRSGAVDADPVWPHLARRQQRHGQRLRPGLAADCPTPAAGGGAARRADRVLRRAGRRGAGALAVFTRQHHLRGAHL